MGVRSFLASHGALVHLVTVLSVVFASSLVGLALAMGLLTTGGATSAQAAPGCAQRMHAQLFFGLHDESPKARQFIDQIAAIYKARFQQESVMVVRAPAFVCF